jgi:hypothetical protein
MKTACFSLLALLLVSCSSRARSPQLAQSPEPVVTGPLRPLAPPSPLALLISSTQTVARQLSTIQCPPPGLPPELAAKVDCAAMKPFEEATQWVPREVPPGTLPPAVDLRGHGLVGPVKNQLDIGACAGFAMTAVLDNAARRQGRADVISPLHVFATYAPTHDDFSRSLKGRSFAADASWPFDPVRACYFARDYMGTTCVSKYGVYPESSGSAPWLLAERQRADEQGRLRILGYEEMPVTPDQWALVLASGEVLWTAFHHDEPAWNSLFNPGSTHIPVHGFDPAGLSHAVAMVGYRTTPQGREFLLQNSWGSSWGMGGFAWISEAMALATFSYGYRVLVADASVPPLPRFDTASFPFPTEAAKPWFDAAAAQLPAWPFNR